MSSDLPSRIGHPAEPPPSRWNYGLGIALSMALTGLLLWIDVSMLSNRDIGYGAIAYMLAALFIGVPLAVALVITWLIYMKRSRGRLPGRVHLLMFAPPLLSLLVIPVGEDIRRADAEQFSQRHPAIQETHVNLSGRPLWLAPDAYGSTSSGGLPPMPMRSGTEARFVTFTRYPEPNALSDGSFPYDGMRLREDVGSYTYGSGDENGPGAAKGRTLPLVRLPYPDLHGLTRYESESTLVVYQYFHYDDRVEVAPGLARMAVTTADALLGSVPELVAFHLSRRIAPAIARLEVNGQTLALGTDGPIGPDTGCNRAYVGIGYALVDLRAPLKLRWQTLDEPSRWHEASVAVPPLRTVSRGAPASFPSVLLYFSGADRVAAEHFQLLEMGDDHRALLATGLPAGVPADEVCGSAMDAYDPAGVTLLR